MMVVTSEEFWINERKRSSLSRAAPSASSFCSMVAPAMRTTKTRTNAPMTVTAVAWPTGSIVGSQPSQMASSPTDMPTSVQTTTASQEREPHLAMTLRAMKA